MCLVTKGTALGIIRHLRSIGRLEHVYCTETRPYNQGSRLTAYELIAESIPATLICDSMASALLQTGKVDAIVVGADRVAANGDTANKIVWFSLIQGTYQLAISAAFHSVPFIVAAPTTSIDFSISSGREITIEERAGVEVCQIRGLNVEHDSGYTTVRIAADGIGIWNPAFDVAPAKLISAIATEKKVFVKDQGAAGFVLG